MARRYGRGQTTVEVKRVDFSEAMYLAKELEKSGQSLMELLGRNIDKYDKKDIERLERKVRKLDHTVESDGSKYSYRNVGDSIVAVKTDDYII